MLLDKSNKLSSVLKRQKKLVCFPIFLMSIVLLPLVAHAEKDINCLIYLSKNSPTYIRAANETISLFKQGCRQNNCRDIKFARTSDPSNVTATENKRLIISYGSKAAASNKISGLTSPVIRTMIPKQLFRSDKDTFPDNQTLDIYIDQPFYRYFKLINAILPRATRIGILIHKSNSTLAKELLYEAKDTNLILNIAIVENDEIGKSLSGLLNDIDVLLAIPDSRIHNSKTIPNILTTSYRNKIPVVGFSSAYSNAGAVASVFTSIDDIARETAEATLGIVNKNKFPTQRNAAKYFSTSINYEVAHSLSIKIPSEDEVTKLLIER